MEFKELYPFKELINEIISRLRHAIELCNVGLTRNFLEELGEVNVYIELCFSVYSVYAPTYNREVADLYSIALDRYWRATASCPPTKGVHR